MWEILPNVLLEEVFLLLDNKQLYACSTVCRHWNNVFHSPRIWRRLVVEERSFTTLKRSVYVGDRYEVCLKRLQYYLGQVGLHTEYIEFKPTTNFYNLYEILRVLAAFLEFFEDYPMPNLRQFHFTFACESRWRDEIEVRGTGGQVLSGIQRLLNDMQDLTDLTVNNLLLTETDADCLLTDIISTHGSSLTHLELLNLSKDPYSLHAIGQLTSLKRLTVTWSHFSANALLTVCSGISSLEEIVLVDDRFTKSRRCSAEEYAILSSVWFAVRQMNDRLRVRLEFRRHVDDIFAQDGVKNNEDNVLPDGSPVHSVIYTSSLSRVTSQSISRICWLYSNTLITYGHLGLGRGYRSRKFCERSDTALVQLVLSCPHLETLVIRERISTATLLIIAREAPALKQLYVRRNAVILRRGWSRDSAWNDEYWNWLRINAMSYGSAEREIDIQLGAKGCWRMLSDAEFKRIVLY